MPGVTTAQIADLIKSTLAELGAPKWNQIAQHLAEFVVMGELMRKGRVSMQGGTSIDGNLLVRDNGTAKMTKLHETVDIAIVDLMEKFSVPWRHVDFHYAFERREMLVNKAGAKRIFDLIKARREGAMLSAARLLEDQWFGAPESDEDDTTMWGLPYWVVKNATTGFHGGAPSGHTLVGGLNPSSVDNWKNHTGTYVSVSGDDLIAWMKTVERHCRFKSPLPSPQSDYAQAKGDGRFKIMMNEATINEYEKFVEGRNDNLGMDGATALGRSTFKRRACDYIPHLDADTTDPVYMLDLAYMYFCALQGDFFHEHEPMKGANQPNSIFVPTNITGNNVCSDRRRQAVAYRVAA